MGFGFMRLFISLLLAASLFTACGSSSDDDNSEGTKQASDAQASEKGTFLASMLWNEPLKPSRDTVRNSGVLTITKKDGSVPAAVEITGFHPKMPGMGHGTSEADQKLTLVAGTTNKFDVTGVHFIMGGGAGEWVVEIAANVDGETDSITLPIPEVK